MRVDATALQGEVERLRAEARRLEARSFHAAVGLLAAFAGVQVIGRAIPRTLWALAFLQLGSAGLTVSAWRHTRPRLRGVLQQPSMGAGIVLLLIVLRRLAERIAT